MLALVAQATQRVHPRTVRVKGQCPLTGGTARLRGRKEPGEGTNEEKRDVVRLLGTERRGSLEDALVGAHVFVGLCLLLMVTIRSFRGHYSPEQHRGVEVPGIYWHFVDIMWVIVYTTVYVL